MLVPDRENGTLAWTASKPVSRASIWLAKLIGSILVIFVLAALIPFAATGLALWRMDRLEL